MQLAQAGRQTTDAKLNPWDWQTGSDAENNQVQMSKMCKSRPSEMSFEITPQSQITDSPAFAY